MVDLSHWDIAQFFSPKEAALLILGLDPAKSILGRAIEPVLVRMACDYLRALEYHQKFSKLSKKADAPSADDQMLESELLLRYKSQPGNDKEREELRQELKSKEREESVSFGAQFFTRQELARWLSAIKFQSLYRFDSEQITGASESRVATPKPPSETRDERCTRLLREFENAGGKTTRGALAVVVKRDGRARQTVTADIDRARKLRQEASNPIARMAQKSTR